MFINSCEVHTSVMHLDRVCSTDLSPEMLHVNHRMVVGRKHRVQVVQDSDFLVFGQPGCGQQAAPTRQVIHSLLETCPLHAAF